MGIRQIEAVSVPVGDLERSEALPVDRLGTLVVTDAPVGKGIRLEAGIERGAWCRLISIGSPAGSGLFPQECAA